ncbi:MAG TPA: sensor histidine kinase, partial [Enterococcus sp.]|nr:sensor histidine kinase [Enterococcus sp.]
MKLFIREHIGLILLNGLQISLFSLIIFLSDFRDYAILLYGIFISLFLLIAYLAFNYYRRRKMYEKLSNRTTDLEQLLEKTAETPIGEAFDHLMKSHYQLFIAQLQEAEDDQSKHLTFIDRWVHQMKTPLSVIELTAKELDEPESSNIREETEKLKNGLQTVLYMARMRTIQEDFQIKPVKLAKIIQDVNQENKRFYIRNEVYPYLTINDQHLTVETDEKWLFFILDQLLHNAVKYTDDRSNRVDLDLYRRAGGAVLAITDYGVGIPSHDQKRIFQAFYTGDNGRKFRESTGMGLYLAKEAADYLGHRIEM